MTAKQLALAVVGMLAPWGTGCSVFHDSKFHCETPDLCPADLQPPCGPTELEMDDPCPDRCPQLAGPIPESPDAIVEGADTPQWDLSLDDAIRIALERSQVMRDLGATVLRTPSIAPTVYEPGLVNTDARFGEAAALSQFDAVVAASAFWENNDRVFNSTFVGDNGILKQDIGAYNVELRKRAATGTQMALRKVTDYDYNNFVGNRFGAPSGSWTTFFDAEIRQPLWQGAGVEYNRIAGPLGSPGLLQGVMIARVRTDIALAEFETGIRDLVSNVENAYWDLYFAYHDLEAKKRARDQALSLWNLVNADLGRSETQDRLLQAQEQYWRFQADVYDSLDGRLIDGTRTNNGSSGGTFRAVGGLRVAERRLRLAMGVPITDGRLIKPATEPTEAPVAYEWRTCAAEALAMRPELRTQRWRVKQRELELIANRNFTAPRLDLAGRYRWRGFGESLVSQSNAQFASAWGNLADGDNQEWQLGVELEMPLGFRQGYNAVRNAELALTRERALLQEQSQTVMFGLSNAFGEVRRAYRVLQTQYNRRDSAQQAAVAISQAREAGRQNLDVVLESQRRLLESELLYRQAQIDYMLAIKAVHFEKGTLLDYYSVTLQEGRAPALAYRDAALRDANRVDAIDYVRRTPVVSTGPVAAAGAPHVQHEAIISDSGSADSRMAAPLPTPAARP